MRSRLILVLTLLGAGCSGRAMACSQCMCGTPFPAVVLGGVVPTQLSYGLEERYLSKSSGLDDGPGIEEEREHRVAAFALWRPLNGIALLGRMPYNFKEVTSRPTDEIASTATSRGWGDAELLVLAGVLRTNGRLPVSVGLVAGGTAPTGSNNATTSGGQRLDAHLQPGSGAWSGTTGLHIALSTPGGTWDASVLDRASGESSHGYRYGNVALYNAGFTSRSWMGAQLVAEVNGRAARRDRLEDGTVGEHTGGMVTYLSPGVRWSGAFGVTLEGAVQVPIAQSLYGVQTEHTTGRLTLTLGR